MLFYWGGIHVLREDILHHLLASRVKQTSQCVETVRHLKEMIPTYTDVVALEAELVAANIDLTTSLKLVGAFR